MSPSQHLARTAVPAGSPSSRWRARRPLRRRSRSSTATSWTGVRSASMRPASPDLARRGSTAAGPHLPPSGRVRRAADATCARGSGAFERQSARAGRSPARIVGARFPRRIDIRGSGHARRPGAVGELPSRRRDVPASGPAARGRTAARGQRRPQHPPPSLPGGDGGGHPLGAYVTRPSPLGHQAKTPLGIGRLPLVGQTGASCPARGSPALGQWAYGTRASRWPRPRRQAKINPSRACPSRSS